MKNYILEILQSHFYSQSEYAALMGMDYNHLYKLLNRGNPMRKTVRRLALGLSRIDGQDWKIHAQRLRGDAEA